MPRSAPIDAAAFLPEEDGSEVATEDSALDTPAPTPRPARPPVEVVPGSTLAQLVVADLEEQQRPTGPARFSFQRLFETTLATLRTLQARRAMRRSIQPLGSR